MPTTHYALWSKDSLGNMQWNSTNVNNYATSTIHSYLNTTYYNTLPTQDKEKLGTKAVVEEFHTDRSGTPILYKQLYGWSPLNTNVWLPSLKEMVGITGEEHSEWGTYCSAMQGLNASTAYFADAQGGIQFAYFAQYNASGGGTAIWNACKQEISWLRSSTCWDAVTVWRVTDSTSMDTPPTTYSHTVHPAVLYNPERPVKQNGFVLIKDV